MSDFPIIFFSQISSFSIVVICSYSSCGNNCNKTGIFPNNVFALFFKSSNVEMLSGASFEYS